MTKVAFFNDGPRLAQVYAQGRSETVLKQFNTYPKIINSENFDILAPELQDLEVIFTTWGMPRLTQGQVDKLPKLKLLLHAAGSVKKFAEPFLNNGVRVISAADANSEPVAEFCLAQILLATKGFFRNTQDCREIKNNDHFGGAFIGKGNYGAEVAFISAGRIARRTMELLAPFNLKLLAVSGSMTPEDCRRYKVELVSMGEAFERAYVISNHLPDTKKTEGLINKALLMKMQQNATLINTGRGAQINEHDLIEVLQDRVDLTALLDVTFPEPSLPDSALYTLENVHLSSHLAGSVNDEYVRMADFVIEQMHNWLQGRELQGEVLSEQLAYIA
ncbi:MAG: hydroxyacid dehydrogenase [Lentisphaerales bacterium]|nr:hydroxyacid dehydrogenase [Lentisphaerales bacterium]